MIFVIALLMTPFTACLNGWALSKLWLWFIVPPFGLPALSVVESIGVSLIVSYLTSFHVDAQPKDETAKDKMCESISRAVLLPLVMVFFGWIIQGFL